jgi:hypothetical protein
MSTPQTQAKYVVMETFLSDHDFFNDYLFPKLRYSLVIPMVPLFCNPLITRMPGGQKSTRLRNRLFATYKTGRKSDVRHFS